MNSTRGLINGEEVAQFPETLQRTQNYKFHMLAVVGIYTGFSISELLKLAYGDSTASKSPMVIKAHKTRKTRQIAIQDDLRAFVQGVKKRYKHKNSDLMFPGRKSDKAMDRTTAFRHLKAAAAECGFERISPHSLRKTYAIDAYRSENGNIQKVSELMNHQYTDTTLNHYILCNFDLQDFLKNQLLG